MLSKIEKKVLAYITSHEFDISKRPFLSMANTLDMREEDIIGILAELRKKEAIKELRAVINHTKAGYNENALICWRVRPDAVDIIKNIFIKNDLISHCYERKPQKEFNYNVFTMMHAKKRKDIETFAREVAKAFAVDYAVLFTEEELKKKLDLKKLLSAKVGGFFPKKDGVLTYV